MRVHATVFEVTARASSDNRWRVSKTKTATTKYDRSSLLFVNKPRRDEFRADEF
jgi:hypothetical protein